MPRVTMLSLPDELPVSPPMKSPQKSSFVWGKYILTRLRHLTMEMVSSTILTAIKPLLTTTNWTVGILGVFLARVSLFGELEPCGIAFFASIYAVSPRLSIFAASGVFCGILSLGLVDQAFIYLFSMIGYVHYYDKVSRLERKMVVLPILLFSVIFISTVLVEINSAFTLYDGLIAVMNAMLCALLYYIFDLAITSQMAAGSSAMNEGRIGLVVMAAFALAGIGHIELWGYGMRNIAGSTLIVLLALIGGAGYGAIMGVAVGLVIGLVEGQATLAIATFAAAGLIAGIFQRLGRVAVVFGYLLGNAVVLLAFGQAIDSTAWLIEVTVAGLCVLCIPTRYLKKIEQRIVVFSDHVQMEQQLGGLNKKLQQVAEIFADLAARFGELSIQRKSEIKDHEFQALLALVGEHVCKDCRNRSTCWEQEFYQSYEAIVKMAVLAEKGSLSERTLPKTLKERCMNQKSLIAEVCKTTEENKTYFYWHNKVADTRQMVTEQMKAVSSIIDTLRGETQLKVRQGNQLAERLMEQAKQLGCPIHAVDVAEKDACRTIKIRKDLCSGNDECRHTLLPLAASLFGEAFCMSAECGSQKQQRPCQITLKTVQSLKLEMGFASVAKNDQDLSGDSHAVLHLPQGKTALILSDGMGTGGEAHQESAMAVHFLEKLLAAGFELDVAVKTANAMLLVKSPGEIFSTIDMAVFDSYTGEMDFLKVGAAPSYVKRVREVATIQCSSATIGMVEPLEIQPMTMQLRAGDVFVLISDGIYDASLQNREEWVANYLRCLASNDPKVIATKLLSEARKKAGKQQQDDMTVIAGRIGLLN
jgi:stage II sporulation protein E